MQLTRDIKNRSDEIIALFRSTFADSEGAAEGDLIGELVSDLLTTTPDQDLVGFAATEPDTLIAAILFTRLTYGNDTRIVFLMSPVAVATSQQGKGIGQKLISHGLDILRKQGVDVAITYGDINFYGRVGFEQISEDIARAPQPLQYPHGWLGQALNSEHLSPLQGASTCVPAFDNPELW